MAPFVTEVENELGEAKGEAAVKLLEQKAKAQTDEVRKQMFNIAQIKFSVIVGQVWFTEFKSLEENSLKIKVDGNEVECTVEMKETKQTL
jgi:hypothetical protein